MRAIALSALLAIACVAQSNSALTETVAGMAAALAENNAPAFLERVDSRMPGYDVLKVNVEALANQADVHSGIDVIQENGQELDVDWTVEITARANPAQKERRRETVHLRFEKRGKKWMVVSLSPAELFAPPDVRR